MKERGEREKGGRTLVEEDDYDWGGGHNGWGTGQLQ